MNIYLVTMALLLSTISLAGGDTSAIENRLNALETKVAVLEQTNPRVLVESECLVKISECEVTQSPYSVGFNGTYSYKVRQTLAVVFENGTISNVNSEKIRVENVNNIQTDKAADSLCKKSQAKIQEMLPDCI